MADPGGAPDCPGLRRHHRLHPLPCRNTTKNFLTTKRLAVFKSSPISQHMESLTETLSKEVASNAKHCG